MTVTGERSLTVLILTLSCPAEEGSDIKEKMAVESRYLTQCIILGPVLLSIENINDTNQENITIFVYFDVLMVKHGVFELQKHYIHADA